MSRLVNQLKTEGNLKQYIIQYLSNTYLYNMITRRNERAIDIINWKKCYGLNKLFRFKACPSIQFATRQEYFGRVEKIKDKKDLKKIKEKITEIVEYEDFEPIFKKKYRYEDIEQDIEYNEIVPYTKHRTVFIPIYKRRKIGKNFYFTTEYKKKDIETTEYKYITKHKKVTSKVRVPYIVTEYKPVTKQKKITRYKTVGYENQVEAIYDYKFKYYICYYLFEMYRENEKGKVIHECFINPFYSKYSEVEPSWVTDNGRIIYVTPETLYKDGYVQAFTDKAKSQIIDLKPKKLRKGYITDFFSKENKYRSDYKYDENVVDCIFFTDYFSRKDNLKIEQVF